MDLQNSNYNFTCKILAVHIFQSHWTGLSLTTSPIRSNKFSTSLSFLKKKNYRFRNRVRFEEIGKQQKKKKKN
ncbi:unnamed protein product, partial [Vitis vinifera]|uniref:Uncharacterized protein n=1 Tax=Vitis vinifera TaxID=29760 RepID=D7U689_VITVI